MVEVLPPHRELWPDPESGPLAISVTVAMVDGRPAPIGVEIWGVDPADLPKWVTGMTPKAAKEKWGLIRRTRRVHSDAETPIRTVDLRIPLGRIVEQVVTRADRTTRLLKSDAVKSSSKWASSSAVQKEADRIRSAIDGTAEPKRRGRKPLPLSHYTAVRDVYTEALGNGEDPTRAVANHFVVSKGQAAKWVHRCRREPLNLLGPTTRGRPSKRSSTEED